MVLEWVLCLLAFHIPCEFAGAWTLCEVEGVEVDWLLGLAVSDVYWSHGRWFNLSSAFVSFSSDAFGFSESSERLFW